MKNSGIEWQEEIQKEIPFIESLPKNWRLIPNRWLFKEDGNKVGADWAKYQLLSLTTTGVKERNIDDVGGKVPTSYDNYQTVKKGQMIFCLFDLDCSAVFSGISKYNGMITSAYDVFSSTDLITNNYIDYWFRYVFSNRYYMMYSKNIRYSVTSDIFKGLKTPVPPITEQQKIAEILDEKCGKIDKLIENEQKQIEKMKEYKQSVITSAVTKGLDKSALMKDSGNDYIGNIPKHWESIKIKYICSMQAGKNLISEQISPMGDYPVYGGNGLRGYFGEYNYEGVCLLVGRQGALCGNVHHVEGKFWATEHAVITKPKTGVYLRYLFYLLIGANLNLYVSPTAAQPGLSVNSVQNIILCKAPIKEQQQIVDYLDEKCGKIDEVISIKQRKIEKLQEYKKSLIYEYVTGKKEVV